MKTFKILCPDCKKEITVALAQKDDPVNGVELDTIYVDEADEICERRK